VLINKRFRIITTTAIKGVSDGGRHVAIYPTTDSGIDCLLETHDPSKDNFLQIMQFSDDPVPTSQTSLPQVPPVQQLKPAQVPLSAASPVQPVLVSIPAAAISPPSSNSSSPTHVVSSATVVTPSVSTTAAHIDPVYSVLTRDPVPPSTTTSSRSKKSKPAPSRVSARTAVRH
jgi:hypothetical protein